MRRKYIFVIPIIIFILGLLVFFRRKRLEPAVEVPPTINACKVRKIEKIGEGAFPRFSPQGTLIAFNKKVGETFEIFLMNPDGTREHYLTCNQPHLSNTGHKGQPFWHPSGEYIIFTAENILFPRLRLGLNAYPDVGRNHNLWIMTPDGKNFWQLTDYENNWG